jgi:hypothetical protein
MPDDLRVGDHDRESRTHERASRIQAFRRFTAQTRKCGGFAQEIETEFCIAALAGRPNKPVRLRR